MTQNFLCLSAVPCTPTNVLVSVSCSQDTAQVYWMQSYGALLYFAIVKDATGNSYYCYSLGTSCLINGLSCGQHYTAKVIGTNLMCNSTESQEAIFMTGKLLPGQDKVKKEKDSFGNFSMKKQNFPASFELFSPGPCPPANIEVSRDCNVNRAVILWQNQHMSGLYTATIEDQSGNTLNCSSSTDNSCYIPAVPCGKTYNVKVTYTDGNCLSTSTNVSMDSGNTTFGQLCKNCDAKYEGKKKMTQDFCLM